MTTSNDPVNAAAPLDEQLVAYLDGELGAESRRRIEALLASDLQFRRRLQSLERTWDLLDELDTAPVGMPFTQTTLEMVTVAAGDDLKQGRAEAPRRRRHWLLTVGGGLLAAVAVGFLAVALLAPDPNRQLLRDLPVLEQFDEYRQIEGLDFLRKLRDAKLFSDESDDPSGDAAAGVEDSVSQRRRRVESMDLSEKEQLSRAEDRFRNLDPAERQRLRRLHEQLQADPDAGRLQALLHHYCEWLKTLSLYSRAELAEMELDDRIEWVKCRRQKEQDRWGGSRPSVKDTRALLKWMNEYLARHEKRFLKTLPEPQRKQLLKMSKPMRRRMVWWQMWQRWRQTADSDKPSPLRTDEDLARLRERLSVEARKRLESLPPSQQWQLVAKWMRHQGMWRHGAARGMHGPLPKADDERLADFFEKKLSDEQRDRLLGLPGEEMQRELQRLFLKSLRSMQRSRRHPGGSSHGHRPAPKKVSPQKPPPQGTPSKSMS